MEPSEPMEEDTPPPPETPEFPQGSCVHLDHYKTENVVACFELLHSYYVACLFKDSWEKKAKNCKCSTCETEAKKSEPPANLPLQFVFACLSCENFSCYDHIWDHALIKLHPLAMDIDCGRIFCAGCRDFRYDPQLENISQNQKKIAARQRGSVTGLTYEGILQREPNLVELELLKYHKIVYRSSLTDARGFRNIEDISCYMIVIIQSFIHAPVFRDYLLSFKHKCKYGINEDMIPVCFICEMINIVQECFSGKSEHFVFGNLFYLYWVRCKKKSRIEMDDAILAYVDLLDQFHQDVEESSSVSGSSSSVSGSSSSSESSCACIIHEIFGFIFESHFICNNCLNVCIPTCEPPSWSIQLFLQSSDPSDQLTLHKCLRSALEEEIPDYKCSKCPKRGCTTKLIPLHLPIVISFNLNDPLDIGRHLEGLYEEFLDMSPYMCMSDGNKHKRSSNLKYQYYLFAVIEFFPVNVFKATRATQKFQKSVYSKDFKKAGQSYPGHYVCYIKQYGQRWIRCNDDKITPVKLKDVLKVEAKMLFYHRMYL